jgi:hypothetical protein
MSITTGHFSVGPFLMPKPDWARAAEANRRDSMARLDAQLVEMERQIAELTRYPHPRRRSTATRPAGKIDTVAIYAERNGQTERGRQAAAAQDALPEPRSAQCRTACLADGSSTPEWCSGETCRALEFGGMSRAEILNQQRLQVERSRSLSARPRSLSEIARSVYGDNALLPPGETGLIKTSARGR